jgi:general secretion pathway protein J
VISISRRAEGGFTLLELLIAITLLGLLLAALFGGLRLGARAWERSEERLDQSARLQVVHNFLRDRLAQAYPLEREEGADRSTPAFAGDADTVQFITLMPEYLGTGFAEFTVAVDDQSEVANLLVRWQRFDPVDPLAADEEPQIKVLLQDIERLEIAYFGALARDQPASWHDRWLDVGQLPQLIRIRVVFPPGDPRRWPDLIVQPMTADALILTSMEAVSRARGVAYGPATMSQGGGDDRESYRSRRQTGGRDRRRAGHRPGDRRATAAVRRGGGAV